MGKTGLQHEPQASVSPPIVNPNSIEEKIPALADLGIIETEGILKGKKSIESKPKKIDIKPAAIFQ